MYRTKMRRLPSGGFPVHRSNVRRQVGRGFRRNGPRQRGAGPFMFLAKFMKPLLRVFKKAGPKALSAVKKMSKTKLGKEVIKETKQTLKTGAAEVAGNLLKGEPEKAKQAVKSKVKSARENIGSMILDSANTNSGAQLETANTQPPKVKRKILKGKKGKKKVGKKKKKKLLGKNSLF